MKEVEVESKLRCEIGTKERGEAQCSAECCRGNKSVTASCFVSLRRYWSTGLTQRWKRNT